MEFCYLIQAQKSNVEYTAIYILCRTKTDLKPCAQIGPKYSNLSAQLRSETDFFFHFIDSSRFSGYPCEQRKTLIRWVGGCVTCDFTYFNSILVIHVSG